MPRPQVPRSDELAAGVAGRSGSPDAATAEALAAIKRAGSGKLADKASASALGRLGGLAKGKRDRLVAETPAIARALGLLDVTDKDFAPYVSSAAEFAEAHCAEIARTVGGGVCGLGPSTMIQSAALELAGSRCAFARGNVVLGSRLAAASRANLMSARDEAARTAAVVAATGRQSSSATENASDANERVASALQNLATRTAEWAAIEAAAKQNQQ